MTFKDCTDLKVGRFPQEGAYCLIDNTVVTREHKLPAVILDGG
jgi:hypothetical protein